MRPDLYSRPVKPFKVRSAATTEPPAMAVPDLPKPVYVDKATECHVTPPDIARRMVDYLPPCGDAMTLEPSAGTGALVDALIEAGQDPDRLVLVERHNTLCAGLDRFTDATIINECFLEWAKDKPPYFPHIIMNPPFKAIKAHMSAALPLLASDGVLVALVPVTYQHPDMVELERLGPDTFTTAKVNTKIIKFKTRNQNND